MHICVYLHNWFIPIEYLGASIHKCKVLMGLRDHNGHYQNKVKLNILKFRNNMIHMDLKT